MAVTATAMLRVETNHDGMSGIDRIGSRTFDPMIVVAAVSSVGRASPASAHTDRPRFCQNPGRSRRGTLQISAMAVWATLVKPSDAHSSRIEPNSRATPEPGKDWMRGPELLAEQREVVEGGVEQRPLGGGVVVEQVAGHGHEQEEQREDREHPEVAHHRGEQAHLVLARLLEHAAEERGRRDAGLDAVDATQAAVPEVQRWRRW